jgi:hypothetical protein
MVAALPRYHMLPRVLLAWRRILEWCITALFYLPYHFTWVIRWKNRIRPACGDAVQPLRPEVYTSRQPGSPWAAGRRPDPALEETGLLLPAAQWGHRITLSMHL